MSQSKRQADVTNAVALFKQNLNTQPAKKFTPELKLKVLEAYATHGRKLAAAAAAGVCLQTVKDHLAADPAFADAWDKAYEVFCEGLESEALRRAIDGWDEPVFNKGKKVGAVRKFSDRLLELSLKRHIPEYRERSTVDLNQGGGVLAITGNHATKDVPAEDPNDWASRFNNATPIDGEVIPNGDES